MAKKSSLEGLKNRKAMPKKNLSKWVKETGLKSLKLNFENKMEGLKFLRQLKDSSSSLCIFDPQYRGVLDKMKYGNEGRGRGKRRSALKQMTERQIAKFAREINRVLKGSAHLFLWVDKFHLCQGVSPWFKNTDLEIVDLLTWDKQKMGMGYRTRRQSEYLVILQKKPRRAKGVWKIHNIPDVWPEKLKSKSHTHTKPLEIQKRLIEAVTRKGDLIIDPASGSFSVLKACKQAKRDFLGCDIKA